MNKTEELSHILFVDDVVMMGEGMWENLKEAEQVLDLYNKVTEMHINVEKPILSENGLPDTVRNRLISEFPYSIKPMSEDFKYLGFVLKPNGYSFKDWMWLYKKIEGRLGCWTNKFLSRGGRFVLLKKVLQSIHVYWATIAYIPKGILHKLRKNQSLFYGKQVNSLK